MKNNDYFMFDSWKELTTEQQESFVKYTEFIGIRNFFTWYNNCTNPDDVVALDGEHLIVSDTGDVNLGDPIELPELIRMASLGEAFDAK